MIDIDPAECVMAVIGVRPILSREVERVTMEQVHRINDLPKLIYKTAKHVVRGEKLDVPLGSVNYKRMIDLVTEEFDESQLEAMANKFPPQLHALTSQFLVDAKKMRKTLLALFPLQQKQTLLGPENILPSAMAVRRFATSLDVLDDPMRVFAHIASGSLLKSQATVVHEMYPSISEAIDDALGEAGENEKVAKKSFQVPPLVSIGWSTWKGIPRIGKQLAKRLQDNYVQASQEKAKPSQQPGGSTSIVAKEALTNTQRALFPQQTSKG